jgi:hypothetical protein
LKDNGRFIFYEPCYLIWQSGISAYFMSLDRGQNIRTETAMEGAGEQHLSGRLDEHRDGCEPAEVRLHGRAMPQIGDRKHVVKLRPAAASAIFKRPPQRCA